MAYTAVDKSTDYFNTKLYTGTGNSNAQTGVGFQPDWIWLKNRSASSNHFVNDVLQGITKELRPNLSNTQADDNQLITAFGSDGFTVGTSGSGNTNGNNYAAWNWKANGSGSSNTAGSINSTVSASTTSGFSIVKWTGNGSTATIGHGLGKVPKMIIVKSLGNTTTWMVQHTSLGNAKEIYLNGTNAAGNSTAWNSTTPTSTVFSVTGGAGDGVNASGDYIAYCFANVKGFSKVSSFIGNGNVDGPFLFCGFKPAFIILKNTIDGAKNWEMLDNKRPGQNPADDLLFPDTVDAESASQTDRLVDFTSTGVKIRGNSAQMNASGQEFIFIAFAAAPFVSSSGIPVTAGV